MNIEIFDEQAGNETLTVAALVNLAPSDIAIEQRVPGVFGRAFELKSWYRAWRSRRQTEQSAEPKRMTVEAVDEFQAVIPWDQLDQAVFLYEQDGQPLKKGFPIRLYVPDGSSECLNVKSVVKIRFEYGSSPEEATYGFKNVVTLDELKLKK